MNKSTRAVKTAFFCKACGHESATWRGQCPGCEAWNTLSEAPNAKPVGARASWTGTRSEKMALDEVNGADVVLRTSTGISEFDRVLGGGLVSGGVVLIGGDPGIGKSTLLLQTLSLCQGLPKLYATGEESPSQVASRGDRLELNVSGVEILAETQLESVLACAAETFHGGRGLLVVDSIQTLYSEALGSAAGTVSQVRECAAQLTRFAKQSGVTVILIGHVTKNGDLAGPRVLEHLVDTVLYFEGDPQSPYRLIRAFKNRFGAAQEIGAFEMTETGLVSIDNPSALFLNQSRSDTPGSAVFVLQEGPRPILLEIQALADDMQGGKPVRLAIGADGSRLAMLLAILHKHGGLGIGDQDVFVNVVGGLRIQETASDLPMLMALISSLTGGVLPSDAVFFGEVGLNGELRPVQRAEERLREAARLGFKRALVPDRNLPKKAIDGLNTIGVKTVADALNVFAEWRINKKS